MNWVSEVVRGRWMWRNTEKDDAVAKAAYEKQMAEAYAEPAPEPPTAVVEWAADYGCSTYPKQRRNHQDKIYGDPGDDVKKVWCDCCGRIPIAVFPMFNRLKHTVRLCEDCLGMGIGVIDNVERKVEPNSIPHIRHYRRE